MQESHKAANVNEMYHAIADEWELTVAYLVIVANNAANMLATTQTDNLANITYFAHTLNMATQQALKPTTVSQLLGRISTIANHELQEKQKLLQLPVQITENRYRWKSTQDMIEQFLE
ncbi:unnamed protein product [Menidia menidia]|uniref:(Atlantic silverside) hypothetical protein n=1 Tax=Menidia menidia TaxID=238744 RepID=A0A8S4B3L2_9TELE|nr:unnamed protein product [Menidia menidia]